MNPTLFAFLAAALVAQATPRASPGDAALRRGDFDAAFAAYTAAAANPSDANAALGLGTIDLYRNDLAGAKTYLTKAAALDPSNPRIKARLGVLAGREPSTSNFRITMAGDAVDVPFVATDPLPVVRATVNGSDVLLFLDTGATAIVLTPQAADRLGVSTRASGSGVFAGGKTGELRAGRIESVAFAGLTVQGVPLDIIPNEGPLEMGGRKLDGAIGTTFLDHFLSTIDYVHGRLILRPRSASADFAAAARRDGASAVPMWLVGDHFIFARAHVNDAPEALFNIDTGGGGLGVQLTKASLAAAGIAPDAGHADSFTGGGGAARVLPFTARSVTLGAYAQTGVPGLYFPDGDQFGIFPFDVAGTLSHEFFKASAVTFDFDAMKLYVMRPAH